jgi:putative two-component system response regulator
MSGVELCKRIRKSELPSYVYFILLTYREHTDDIVQGLSAGADDFVSKPFEPLELRARVNAGKRLIALETRDMVIFALARLAESRDPETGLHLDRIRAYSRALAQQLMRQGAYKDQIEPSFAQLIYLTSPLHDIGKIGIPDAILLKPGKLTEDEFEIMKRHTTIGADTLNAAIDKYPDVEFLKVARDIALTHHERFDGTGYPQRLRGEEIPLCGRIVALADVYDAMRSKRVYKSSFSHAVTRSKIVAAGGTHFDPVVVEAFCAIEESFRQIDEALRGEESETEHSMVVSGQR